VKQDNANKHTIVDDVKTFMNKYKFKFNKFWNEEKKKSSLLESMYDCSAKMTAICFYIFRSPGPVMIYSNYVRMEGLEILKIYLSYFNYGLYDHKNPSNGTNYLRYVEFHGGIDRPIREIFRQKFNDKSNVDGKYIKILLLSPAGSEGITLANVRQVHVLEPYWNEVRMHQVIARAIRSCAHKDLPMKERNAEVFRYKVVRGKGQRLTTDQDIEEIAKSKEILLSSFTDTLKEVAVDCELFKSHNQLTDKYKCFQFDEPSLFDKNIGPAYKEDLYYDVRLNNGLNNPKSITKKIKVIKIKAVVKKEEGSEVVNEENKTGTSSSYSEVKEYWYNPESGIIYDLDLDYPVGKVGTDDHGNPDKLNKDTYIISTLINIPLVKYVNA
jgi:hypothetical protein